MVSKDETKDKAKEKKVILVANGPFRLKSKGGNITKMVSGDRIEKPTKFQLDQADGNVLREVEVKNA